MKEEGGDFNVVVTDALLKLKQTDLAANARMDRFDRRLDRLVDQMHEMRAILEDVHTSVLNLIDMNRRAIAFTSSEE